MTTETKFILVADPHFFKNSLGAYGPGYDDFMSREQKCYAETEKINLAVLDWLKKQDISDTILIAGDLSFNGEKESHEEYSRLLSDLKAAGKRIFVITAGHDISPDPFCYKGGDRESAEGIKFDDLYGYYGDFGYNEAVSFFRKYMSYTADLSNDVRLLALCNDSPDDHGIAYTDELLDWVKDQLKQAKEEGRTVIAMEHYPIIAGQPIFNLIPDARQKNAAQVIDILSEGGCHLMFTGHMHNMSINSVKASDGSEFFDVCTGSVIGWPAFMRAVTITKTDGRAKARIESIPVPDFDWDTKGKTCRQYLIDQFDGMIRNFVSGARTDPERTLRKIRLGDKKALFKPFKVVGTVAENWSVARLAHFLWIPADNSLKNVKVIDFIAAIVRQAFEGNQPYVEGTSEGDVVLRLLRRFRPLLKKVNLKGSQGEQMDLYDTIRESLGNYGLDDYTAEINI